MVTTLRRRMNRVLHGRTDSFVMTDDATLSTLVVINERNAHRRINDLLRRRAMTQNEPNEIVVDAYVKWQNLLPLFSFHWMYE